MDGQAMIDTFLYTDEPAMAAGLRELLSGAPDVRLGHHCDNLGALKATLGKIQPDLLLLDVTPEVTVRTIYEVRECAPECRIVLWVRTVTKELAFQAIEHGVRGILRKRHRGQSPEVPKGRGAGRNVVGGRPGSVAA